MIKLCVFDMDGTIYDSIEDLAYAMNYALAKHNLPTHNGVHKFKYFVGDGQRVFVLRALGEPLNQNEELVDSVQRTYAEYYNENYSVFSKPYDGIIELLKFLGLNGCKMAVLTNKPTEFAVKICEAIFTDIKFEFIIGPSEQYPKKPDITALNMMLESLNVKQDECLYFGDTNTDMITANNAKVIPVGVSWGFRAKEELINSGAKYIIDHPLQAIELYNKLKE